MPALACAWRIEDADQGTTDQDHFMRGVCCGLTRSVEVPRSDQKRTDGVALEQASPEPRIEQAHASRVCAELGPFANRYLGAGFKLGESVLCWRTVETPCGGWQVYSSDPRWLSDVSDGLRESSCSTEERSKAAGIGFCDGARAASLLRRWQPLVTADGNQRVARGLQAISAMLERLGRIRFRYELPTPSRVHAEFDLEPMGRLLTPARRAIDASKGSTQ